MVNIEARDHTRSRVCGSEWSDGFDVHIERSKYAAQFRLEERGGIADKRIEMPKELQQNQAMETSPQCDRKAEDRRWRVESKCTPPLVDHWLHSRGGLCVLRRNG